MADASAASRTQTRGAEDASASADEDERRGKSQNRQDNGKESFIGSIDQGTTSSRFLIFDGTGTPVASHQVEFKQMYPESG